MLKDPLEIVHHHLAAKLGSPVDISKVLENQEGFELDKRVEIPYIINTTAGGPSEEPMQVDPPVAVKKEEPPSQKTFHLPVPVEEPKEARRQPM